METITYNPKDNSIMVCVDGKPRAGMINCGSLERYRKILRNRLCKLNENIEAIDEWFADKRNLNHFDKQVELRCKRNEFALAIKRIESELNPKKNKAIGIREVNINTNLYYNNYGNND